MPESDTPPYPDGETAEHAAEERYRQIEEHAPIGLALVAPDGRWLRVNPALCRLVGYSAEELLARTLRDITHPDDVDTDLDTVQRLLAGEIASFQAEKRYIRKDGAIVWTLRSVSLVRDATGAPLYFIAQIQDIDALKQAEAALRASEARYRELVELAQEGIWQFDTELRTTYVNQRMAELLGCRQADMLGRPWWDFMDAEGRALAAKTMALHPEGHAEPREYKFIRADGRPLWALLTTARLLDSSGERSGAFATVTDITARKRDEDRLRHAAQHDMLTGLANRAFFADQLELALAVRSTNLALLVLDLDGFKSVNDSLGHAAGDVLLRMVALRLQGVLRATDTIARLGGDEFALILPGTGKYGAMAVARKALAAVKAPLDIQGHHVEVSGSIGVALAPQHGSDSATLLHRADAAMYRAKRGHLEITVYTLD